MLNVRITDPRTTTAAKVSANGELIVSRIDYPKPYYVALASNNQIYNVVPAQTGRRFVVTGMIISTNRNVTGDAEIKVYQSTSDDGVSDGDLLTLTVSRAQVVPLTGLDFVTDTTHWINATTDDNTVDMTVTGYYID